MKPMNMEEKLYPERSPNKHKTYKNLVNYKSHRKRKLQGVKKKGAKGDITRRLRKKNGGQKMKRAKKKIN